MAINLPRAIRGIRQVIPSGFLLGRSAPGSSRGQPGLVPLPPSTQQAIVSGASGKASAGGGTTFAGYSQSTTTTITAGAGITVSGSFPAYTISLTSPVTVAHGGTGLTAGTSGGVLAFTASGTIASSAQLANRKIVIGGGAGAVPKTDNWSIDSSHNLTGPGADDIGLIISGGSGNGLRIIWDSAGSGSLIVADTSTFSTPAPMEYSASSHTFSLSSGNAAVLDGTSGWQAQGTTTNNNAAAGNHGEFVSATSNATSQTDNTVSNLTSISLTAGDWDVHGSITYVGSGNVLTDAYCCVSKTTADTSQSNMLTAPWARTTGTSVFTSLSETPPPLRVSISTTTTVYLVAYCRFASGTATASGSIQARRVR